MAKAPKGNSIDRFLIRAIIALTFLMIGVMAGFSLAVFYPKQPVVAQTQPAPECEPAPQVPSEIVEPPAEPPAEVEETGAVAEGDGDGDGDGDEAEEGEETESEPEVEGEVPRIAGNLIVEIRDVSADIRTKGDIRLVAKRGGPELEACIAQHAPDATVVRVHHQLYVEPSGKVFGKLLLGGSNPELEACVGKSIESWNFGPATANSFFKLKLIWTP